MNVECWMLSFEFVKSERLLHCVRNDNDTVIARDEFWSNPFHWCYSHCEKRSFEAISDIVKRILNVELWIFNWKKKSFAPLALTMTMWRQLLCYTVFSIRKLLEHQTEPGFRVILSEAKELSRKKLHFFLCGFKGIILFLVTINEIGKGKILLSQSNKIYQIILNILRGHQFRL